MTRKSTLAITILMVLATWYVYHGITHPSIDQQAEKLWTLLQQLSGEIKQLRLTADTKEDKYDEIIWKVGNYHPVAPVSENKENATIPPIVSDYKCIIDKEDWSTEIALKKYEDSKMEFVESCWAFDWYKWCFISPENTNCFKISH